MITYNFRKEPYRYAYPKECERTFRDLRNGIDCINPSADLECYFNYLQLLNAHTDQWRSVGYLDKGMMPLVMGPSFMHEGLMNLVMGQISNLEIQPYRLKPVTLLYEDRKLPFEDIWVFREDAAKLMGISNGKVTAEQFLRWCFRNELNRVK